MSKKNSLKIRARQHAFDLRREAAEKERLQKLADKHARKVQRQVAAGAVKKKSKGVRLRKGIKIRGIKVEDAESKKKVLQVLKAEQAMQQMEVDGEPAVAGLKKAKKKVKLVKIKRKGARSEDGSSSRSRRKPGAAAAAAAGSGDGVAAMQLA